MPEVPENHPELSKWLAILQEHLKHYVGRPFTSNSIDSIISLVDSISADFKARTGYDFPPLGPFILPTSKQIILYRRDLDNNEIRNKIIYLLRDFAKYRIPVSQFELAKAIKLLWPKYDPPVEEIRRDPKIKLLN